MKELVPAKEMYRKFPELKAEDVQELTEWIRQHPEYPIPTEEDVMRFLISCYFNMDNAKKCVQKYYSIRLGNSELFLNRDVLRDELKEQLDVVEYGIMANKDSNGYTVALHRLKIFDTSRYVFTDSAKLFGMLIDALNRQEGCMNGVVMIFDNRGVSFMHLLRLKMTALILFLQYAQEGCPIRLKAVHIVNTLPVTAKIMFVIRPFINKEILELLHFHSDNYEDIQQHVPLDCLPSDFGGTQPSIAQHHEEFKKLLLDLRDEYMEDDKEMSAFIDMKKQEAEATKKKSSWSFF